MMNTSDHDLLDLSITRLILRCSAVIVFGAIVVTAQSRIISPAQPKPTPSNKLPHTATLRATDSPDGSRVAVTSDRSLTDYEAYRRGDRFYVRIPAADVPRAEAARGRAFADVKAQRSGESTLLSFRLQPGATAHVEQRSNRLDIVIALPGTRASITPPNVNANTTGTSRVQNSTQQNARGATTTLSNSNSNRGNTLVAQESTASRSTAAPTPKPSPKPAATPKPTPTPRSSPTPKASPTPTPIFSPAPSPAAVAQATIAAPSSPSQGGWANFKQRLHYWTLLAQLNPVPVGIGVALLLLLIGMLFFRRRDRPAGRARAKEPKTSRAAAAITKEPDVKDETAGRSETSEVTGVSAVSLRDASASQATTATESPRQLRINQVGAEAKKLLTSEDYDRNVIGATDPETRQLVAAELLSALVGRNAERRERARNAFMQHGYFEDATRDLRIAGSSNERAAAARRLSFLREREATPHLIAALGDSSPDVRRAAVEALMDLREPSAIGPLNSLLQKETDRKVPGTLIKHAIEACATSTAEEATALARDRVAPPAFVPPSYQPEPEREVFEL